MFIFLSILQKNNFFHFLPLFLELLFSYWRISSIDLSGNRIGRLGANAIAKTLKEKGDHLEWLE